ncbi:MAG: anti-sigma factor [Gaiellales bacterium]
MTDEPFHDDPALARLERLLRETGPAPEPSAELRARLLEIPGRESRPAPARRSGPRGLWSSVHAWRFASGALAVAAVVLAVVALTSGSSSTAVSGTPVALTTAPDYHASGDAVSMVSDGLRRIHVQIDGLPALRDNAVFELWIARDRTHRVSLGVFRPTATGRIDATVSVPDLGPGWQSVWLTREPGTGTPGWSRDWVVAGRLV